MDMSEHTGIPILSFNMMNKVNVKIDEACGVKRKGKCYMSEAKRIKARNKRKRRK